MAFSFFPVVKMAANYAETGTVGKMGAGLQKVPHANYTVMKHQLLESCS